MNKQSGKYWMFGFLGFMCFFGIRYFYTKNWIDLLWLAWVIWFVYFIPNKEDD